MPHVGMERPVLWDMLQLVPEGSQFPGHTEIPGHPAPQSDFLGALRNLRGLAREDTLLANPAPFFLGFFSVSLCLCGESQITHPPSCGIPETPRLPARCAPAAVREPPRADRASRRR